MKSISLTQSKQGFTLIEMIVSLAVFSVVVTIAVGSLMTIIFTNQRLQKENIVMTNLSFALDTMTREIRTGTDYFCYGSNTEGILFDNNTNLDTKVVDLKADGRQDCPNGRKISTGGNYTFQGLAFKEAGNSITGDTSDRILYFFDEGRHALYRRVGNNPAEQITSSGIHIESAEFFVTGSESLTGGTPERSQPTVTIFIKAKEKATDNDITETYEIQTTVVQRILDI